MASRCNYSPLWLTLLIMAVILVPYALFNGVVAEWTADFLRSSPAKAEAALVIVILLAVDVLLPVPSSLVGTASGYLLDFLPGTLASLLGMTGGCLAGYWLGAKCGRSLATRLVRPEDLERLEDLQRRYGDWAIVVARSIPVLAEVSVLGAGLSGLPFRRYALLTALANLGIAVVYAAVGAFAAGAGSFLLAFAGALLLPGTVIYLTRRRSR